MAEFADAFHEFDAPEWRADEVEAFAGEEFWCQVVGCEAFLLGQVLEGAVVVLAVAVPAAGCWGFASSPEGGGLPGVDLLAEVVWEVGAGVDDPADGAGVQG